MKTSEAVRLTKSRSLPVFQYLLYVVHRFKQDDGLRVATALSFTSLLAMVPLTAISLAIISAFPAFDDLRAELLLDLYSMVLPQMQVEVARHFEDLVENARSLTAVGVVGLAVTAIMLLSTIVQALNRIWRVPRQRPLAMRILVYWACLTIGPLLFGTSLTLTSYLYATAQAVGIDAVSRQLPGITYAVPLVIETIGFALLYFIVPNARVDIRHALAGGIVAAVLFELLKNAFGLYLTYAPTYQTVYGALAAIPIMLLWLYGIWAVLIIGAEAAVSIREWRDAQIDEAPAKLSAHRRLIVALALLDRLAEAHRAGGYLRHKKLLAAVPAAPSVADAILHQLSDQNYAARRSGGRWLLSRDLHHTSLADLIDSLGLSFDTDRVPKPRPDQPWTGRLKTLLERAETARGVELDTNIADILASTPEEGSDSAAAA